MGWKISRNVQAVLSGGSHKRTSNVMLPSAVFGLTYTAWGMEWDQFHYIIHLDGGEDQSDHLQTVYQRHADSPYFQHKILKLHFEGRFILFGAESVNGWDGQTGKWHTLC